MQAPVKPLGPARPSDIPLAAQRLVGDDRKVFRAEAVIGRAPISDSLQESVDVLLLADDQLDLSFTLIGRGSITKPSNVYSAS